MKRFFAQYRPLGAAIGEVWIAYGRSRALFGSPTLHVSALIALLSWGSWLTGEWWKLGLDVLPSLLGFSIATFAIFFAIGDERFRQQLSGAGPSKIASMVAIYSSFVFLIFAQTAAVLISMFASGRPLTTALAWVGISPERMSPWMGYLCQGGSTLFRFIGYTAIIFAILSIVPMALSVLRMGKGYLIFLGAKVGRSDENGGAENKGKEIE